MNRYEYNKEYQTLQQYDEKGMLRSSMSMPQTDLNKLAQLNIKENILRDFSVLQSSNQNERTPND